LPFAFCLFPFSFCLLPFAFCLFPFREPPVTLRLGTRGSQLALWQARTVAARLADSAGVACELVTIRTGGDQLADAPLSQVGGKRLFVKELEDALEDGRVDLAVHSAKDMPAVLPAELVVGAVLPREDPRDAIVLSRADGTGAPDATDPDALGRAIGPEARVGTGSIRRIAQLKRLMPAAAFTNIRGNLDSRLRKLDEGGYDLLVLACAGLKRLGFADRISMALPVSACVPAPNQGIVAIEVRAADRAALGLLARIEDPATRAAFEAERALVRALGGGCQTPVGAVALFVGPEETALELHAIVTSLDGTRVVRRSERGAADAPAQLGESVAAALLADGAGAILDEVRSAQEGMQS
jgi:hydroxymethylbilane synthase